MWKFFRWFAALGDIGWLKYFVSYYICYSVPKYSVIIFSVNNIRTNMPFHFRKVQEQAPKYLWKYSTKRLKLKCLKSISITLSTIHRHCLNLWISLKLFIKLNCVKIYKLSKNYCQKNFFKSCHKLSCKHIVNILEYIYIN